VEKTDILPLEDVRIVHYDEQHPKQGRTQKYRLTLLDGVTCRPLQMSSMIKKIPGPSEPFLPGIWTQASGHLWLLIFIPATLGFSGSFLAKT